MVWLISLKIFVSMLIIGLILRFIAEKTINVNFKTWGKNGDVNLKAVYKENWFLGFLLTVNGVCENLSLLGIIVGIPLYFVLHI